MQRVFTVLMAGLFCVLIALPTPAQESLSTLMERGYVTQWLVCGPFRPDVDGGIVAAVSGGSVPLGDTDFMEPLGGVARIRPKHLDRVQPSDAPKGEYAYWQRAKGEDETFDLAPFFPGDDEGLAYAAFYAVSDRPVDAYVDVQTLLGARIWLNGFPVKDIRPASAVSGGTDRFMAEFRQGTNVMVLEVPGATFEALAPVTGLDAEALRARVVQTRPLLTGASGFQFALRIKAVRQLGNVAYVPRLESTGGFSEQDGELRQTAELTLYNPTNVMSSPVHVEVQTTGGGEPLREDVPPLPPESQEVVSLALPTGAADAGQAVRVEVTLETEGKRDTFATSVNALAPPEGGRTYVVTGAFYRPGFPEDQRAHVERRLRETRRQLVLMEAERDYGFALGTMDEWRPFWDAHPEAREGLRRAVDRLQCAAHGGYGVVDERIVSGELLVRNLAYGYHAVKPRLGDTGMCYYAWGAPAIAPQTPQLLAKSDVRGVVSSLPVPGIPEIFRHRALDGNRVLHRRKRPSNGPASVEELQDLVYTQLRELLARGFTSDVFVSESLMPPPEPFYLGACRDLKRSIPSILVTGSGGVQFLEEARSVVERGSASAPTVTSALNGVRPGELLAQPDLKRAHGAVENLVGTAEKLATFASLVGATYPDLALDHAWRQLLYLGSPERVGFCRSSQDYVDALAAYREAAERAQDVVRRAASYIAEQTDTFHDVPVRLQGTLAVVVFNPSSWTRTDVCDVELSLDRWRGLKVFGPAGAPTPFSVEETRLAEGALSYARVRFVAKDVPSLGYRTYYVGPDDALPRPVTAKEPVVENEFYRVAVDASRGGAIVSLVDKASGAELANGIMNHVVALEEDGARNGGGRDVWASPPAKTPSPWPAEVRATILPGIQRLHISMPFEQGVVEREIALYEGVARVDCVTRLRKVAVGDQMMAATFEVAPEGRAPVFGERFGALVGRHGQEVMDFRAAESENPSGCGLQPSQRWVATSPNDRIEAGFNAAVPLGPALLIYGAGSNLGNAANRVQEAFLRRAIPCTVMPDTPEELSQVWTDSTEFEDFETPLRHGVDMRIVLGGPKQNEFAKRLFADLSEDDVGRFEGQLSEGAYLFFYDGEVEDGLSPVPTLVVGGYTAANTEQLGHELADAVEVHGVLRIPPVAYAPTKGHPQAEAGLAVLHTGSALASVEGDGAVVLGFCHGSDWEETSAVKAPPVADTQVFRYALYPFAGTWREAQVPRAAHAFNEPFVAASTGLHLGSQPTEQRFLQADDGGFIVTAVKPSGYSAVMMRQTTATPRDGIEVRGYESLGQPALVDLRFFAPLRKGSMSSPMGAPAGALMVAEGIASFESDGFGVETLTLVPGGGIQQGEEASLGVIKDPYGPVFTRYWQYNPGAAPLGGLPLTLLISGDLAPDDASVTVTVANNTPDRGARGTVQLNVPEGWKLAPARFDYDLASGEFVQERVIVLRHTGTAPDGGVVATTEFEGRTYRDVLAHGKNEFGLDVKRSANEVRVLVKNNSPLHAEGYLDIVAPTAWWPELGPDALGSVTPRRAAVSVPPFREQRILFRTGGDVAPPWMVLKLAVNGEVVYERVPE